MDDDGDGEAEEEEADEEEESSGLSKPTWTNRGSRSSKKCMSLVLKHGSS